MGNKCQFLHPGGKALPAARKTTKKTPADTGPKAGTPQAKAAAAAKRAAKAQSDAAKAQKLADEAEANKNQPRDQ